MKSFTANVTLFLKLMVNILSIFVAFLENMYLNSLRDLDIMTVYVRRPYNLLRIF